MSSPARPTAAEMIGVTKRYGHTAAVDDISLAVREGEFFSILGPSGCGKTTTLRMFGGFVRPDAGEIKLGGLPVSRVPPHKRDVNTVFQSYALFTHLSVADNVAFGLRRRGIAAAEVRERVAGMLRIVSLADRGAARPAELSGGQQQRVALARALVNMPKLLLLDEPLGALDLKLRRQMQLELKHIQQEVGIAFVYVTHDQEEALTMSDRIAVMDAGRVLQIGTPSEIYTAPRSLFVAQFIGSTNTLKGVVTDRRELALDCGVTVAVPAARMLTQGTAVTGCVRPEKVILTTGTERSGSASLTGTVTEAVYLGSGTTYRVTSGAETIEAFVANDSAAAPPLAAGSRVSVTWRPEDCLLFDEAGAVVGPMADIAAAAPLSTRP